jgi:hypothetical protein
MAFALHMSASDPNRTLTLLDRWTSAIGTKQGKADMTIASQNVS